MKSLVLILLSLAAWSQQPLTLADAIRLGLDPRHRAALALAESNRSRAELSARQTRAAMLPSVDIRATGGEQTRNLATLGIGSLGTGPANLNPSFTSFDTRAAVNATLLDLSARKTHEAARRDIARTADDLESERHAVAAQIARVYYDALRANERIALLTANLALSRELEDAARIRLAAGTVTSVDLLRARAQTASDNSALTAAKFEAEKAELTLRRWIGLPLEGELRLQRPATSDALPDNPAAIIPLAESHRPDLASQQKREQVAALRVTAARRKFLPTISGSADYGPNGLTPANTANTRSLSLSLNIPVFDGGHRRADLSQAELVLRDEETRTRDLRRQIHLDVILAHRSVTSARTRSDLTKAELDLAEQQLTQSRARLSAGLGLELDLADAQTRLIRARDSRDAASHQLDLARLDLLIAAGQLQGLAQ